MLIKSWSWCVLSAGLSDDQWEGMLVVGQEDLLEALEKLKPSVSPAELQRYQDLKSTMRS